MMYHFIALVLGIVFLVISLFILKQSLNFVKRSEHAIGTVIELKEISNEGDISYLPVFSIPINNGKEIIYTHHSSSKPASWDIGEKAEFLYDPNDLRSARLFRYFDVFSWTIVLMGLAAYLITTAGGYFYFKSYLKTGQN